MKAAQTLFQRIAPTLAKTKRTGKARGASGRSIHQLRADVKRAAKKEAKTKRLQQPKAKGEPRRPPEPRGSEPEPP